MMRRRSPGTMLVVAVAALALSGPAGAGGSQPPSRTPDIGYVPTPQNVVEAMLDVAGVTSSDVVYDLGSGDGRIAITAAQKYGARAVGIDIDPERIAEANANAVKAGVTGRVRFLHQDLFLSNISEATVVTLYLYPDVNLKLLPKLNAELKPGTRVVSHAFEIGDIPPKQSLDVGGRPVYLFVVPIQ